MPRICSKLEVQEGFRETLVQLIYLLFSLLSYDSFMEHGNKDDKFVLLQVKRLKREIFSAVEIIIEAKIFDLNRQIKLIEASDRKKQ